MRSERSKWLIPVVIIALIAAFAAGWFLSKQSSDQKYKEEQELNAQLERSDLDGLGEIDGPIYISGHKSPDSDTVGSSIAYAALLQKLGYDAHPVVLGKINSETEYILEQAGMETPEQLEDASGLNMILVDHSEYIQSAEGLKDANIISIIDHHGDGTVTTADQIIYDARPLGSTATIIWLRYRNYGVDIDPQVAQVMLGSVLSDTSDLNSQSTTFADTEAVKTLSALAGVTDVDAFYDEMYKASMSYEGFTDEEIFFSDYKEYEAGGKTFSIGCINVYDEDDAGDMAERMHRILTSLADSESDMAFAQISIFHDDISITYIVPSDKTAGEVLEAAFGDNIERVGPAYVFRPGVSRKKVLVPVISDVLNAHPKE